MTLEQKLHYLKNIGFTYNYNSGKVFSHKGNEVKGKDKDGYTRITFYVYGQKKQLQAHQFAWFYYYNEVPNIIDHINRDKSDNRINNIRNVNKKINSLNTETKGYSVTKYGTFNAYIHENKKKIDLGCYRSRKEAISIHYKAKKELISKELGKLNINPLNKQLILF